MTDAGRPRLGETADPHSNGPAGGCDLYVHVGHGKTGSSAIQSALANTGPILEQRGYPYPEPRPGWNNNARHHRISSGNVPLDLGIAGTLETIYDRQWPARVVFSSEHLFHLILDQRLADEIADLRSAGGRPHVLLLIRDPFDHVQSWYQQRVKRHGITGPLDDYASEYVWPQLVLRFIEILRAIDVEPMVRNYSRWSTALDEVIGEWLGLEPSLFAGSFSHQVNRSLTIAELELQKLFNEHIGERSSVFISDALVDELPSIRSESAPWTPAGLRDFHARMQAQIAATNALLPDGEQYVLPALETALEEYCSRDDHPARFAFSHDQLAVVVSQISTRLVTAEEAVSKAQATAAQSIENAAAAAGSAAAVEAELQRVMAERDRLIAVDVELQQVMAERDRLIAVEAQLGALQSSRTFRWTLPVRRLYARVRSRPMLLQGVGALAWVVALAGLSLSRQGGTPAWTTLWAEDGSVFLERVWADPPGLLAVVEPYAGYLHIAPRLLAIPAGLLAPESAAGYVAVTAAVVFGLVTLAILRLTGGVLGHLAPRLVIAASPVLLPAMAWSNLNNITYLLWLFLFAGFWAVVAPSRSGADTTIRVVLVVVGALSHPLLVVYVPLAVFCAVRRRGRGDRLTAGALIVALLVQASVVATADQVVGRATTVGELIGVGFQRVIGSVVVGEAGLEFVWERWGWVAIVVVSIALVIVLAALLAGSEMFHRKLALVALAYAVIIVGVALVNRGTTALAPIDGGYARLGMRYFVVSILLVWSAVAILLDDVRPTLRWRVTATAVTLVLVATVVSSWQLPNRRSGPPIWATESAAAAEQCRDAPLAIVAVEQSPPSWVVEIPCHSFR